MARDSKRLTETSIVSSSPRMLWFCLVQIVQCRGFLRSKKYTTKFVQSPGRSELSIR